MARKVWAGVRLTESTRDRVVAEWLDRAAASPDVNVSDLVKNYLYTLATGEDVPPVTEKLKDLRHVDMEQILAGEGEEA